MNFWETQQRIRTYIACARTILTSGLTWWLLTHVCYSFHFFFLFFVFLHLRREEKEVDPRAVAGLVASLYTAAAVCKCMGTQRLTAPWATAYWAQSNLDVVFLRHEATEPGVEEEYQNFVRSSPVFSPPSPQQYLIYPNKAGVSFAASLSLALCAWIVNGRNKLSSVQSRATATTTAARLPSHHGCKILSDRWWEFYPGRSTEPGFCPLFGLLQLQ